MSLPVKVVFATSLPVILTIAFVLIGSIYPDTSGDTIIRIGAGLVAVLCALVTGLSALVAIGWHKFGELREEMEEQGIDVAIAVVRELNGARPNHIHLLQNNDHERARRNGLDGPQGERKVSGSL